jgi:MFS family permease
MVQLRARWLFLLAWGLWAAQGRFLGLLLLELGLTDAQLGVVIAVPTYCNMVLPVLWGICADRLLEWRKVLTICSLGGAACYSLLLIPATHKFWYILPIRTAQCMLISGIMPVLDATVLRMIDHDAAARGSASDAMSRRAVYGRERVAGTVGWCLTHFLLGLTFMYYPYLYMVYANISLSVSFVCYIWICDPPAFTSGAAAVEAA